MRLNDQGALVDRYDLDSSDVDAKDGSQSLREGRCTVSSEELRRRPVESDRSQDRVSRNHVQEAAWRDEELQVVYDSHIEISAASRSRYIDGFWLRGVWIHWLGLDNLSVHFNGVSSGVGVRNLNKDSLGLGVGFQCVTSILEWRTGIGDGVILSS